MSDGFIVNCERIRARGQRVPEARELGDTAQAGSVRLRGAAAGRRCRRQGTAGVAGERAGGAQGGAGRDGRRERRQVEVAVVAQRRQKGWARLAGAGNCSCRVVHAAATGSRDDEPRAADGLRVEQPLDEPALGLPLGVGTGRRSERRRRRAGVHHRAEEDADAPRHNHQNANAEPLIDWAAVEEGGRLGGFFAAAGAGGGAAGVHGVVHLKVRTLPMCSGQGQRQRGCVGVGPTAAQLRMPVTVGGGTCMTVLVHVDLY